MQNDALLHRESLNYFKLRWYRINDFILGIKGSYLQLGEVAKNTIEHQGEYNNIFIESSHWCTHIDNITFI